MTKEEVAEQNGSKIIVETEEGTLLVGGKVLCNLGLVRRGQFSDVAAAQATGYNGNDGASPSSLHRSR